MCASSKFLKCTEYPSYLRIRPRRRFPTNLHERGPTRSGVNRRGWFEMVPIGTTAPVAWHHLALTPHPPAILRCSPQHECAQFTAPISSPVRSSLEFLGKNVYRLFGLL